MSKTIEGIFNGLHSRFAIVVCRTNHFITDRLLEGALDGLLRHGVSGADIEVVKVPGAFEIPLMSLKMAQTRRYSAVICLGAVIRGGTSHFEYISQEVTKGIANVAFNCDVPVIFGVLTTDTIEQAIERAGTKAGNKGYEAALSALELADLFRQLS